MMGSPSHWTDFEPLAVSEDIAMLGYGMGIGPMGVGVLQTSGKAMTTPLLFLCTTVMKLTITVAGMTNSYGKGN